NPVTESLFIDYGTDGFNTFSVRVFNALGEEVRFPAIHETTPFAGQIVEIDVSDWATGTYFISISGNEKNFTRKFIKL
ncbi:MAG: T9SS type A sorting domain-containing protein, partial [Saprospiraceae bacterium]